MTANVPSNLIPSRVTQLPTAPVASADGLLLFTYEGTSYQIRAGDLLQVTGVPTTRQVIAGTGMTGGGPLSADVTLSIANGGVGTTQLANSGATAGTYGDAGNVPVVTVDATGRVVAVTSVAVSVAGYVPTSRQIIAGAGLEGGGNLNANVTLTADFEDTAPLTGTTSGSAGTLNELSRGDHRHPPVDLSNADQIDGTLPIDQGGTGRSNTSVPGGIAYGGGNQIALGAAGALGQVLISGGTGSPTWGSALIESDQAANLIYGGPAAGADAPTLFRSMVNADLPASGVTAGTYGSSTLIPVVTVDAKGVVTGVTTASFQTGLSYEGVWNASTNSPALASGTGTQGDYYIVSVAGTTNLDGVTDWQVGDWAVFSGAVWQKLDQTNTVTSVNSQVGVVVLTAANVGATALDGTGATGTWAIGISGTAASATNVAGGAANQIVYNTSAGVTSFLAAPTVTDTFLKWTGSAFTWTAALTTAVTSFSAGSTGLTPSTGTTGAVTLSGTLAVANGGTGVTSGTGTGSNVLNTSPTFVTPVLGTPTSGTLTNATGLPLTTGVTGTLPVANGGTGVTTETGTGANVLNTSPTLVTPILGTPTSGTLTNATGLPLTTGVTGTLAVANGGTGATSLTANNIILGNGTSAVQVLAPATSGNILTSNGATWLSTTGVSGGTF
jgi:hypothetical protein